MVRPLELANPKNQSTLIQWFLVDEGRIKGSVFFNQFDKILIKIYIMLKNLYEACNQQHNHILRL